VYETPSDSSQQQWQPWKNQDLVEASSVEQSKYRPVTFDDVPDTQQKESQQPFYNANIQSSTSGVADVVSQQSIESVVDNILVSNRQGRNLEGYDEIYSDPNVKNALQLGNDTIARTYIRDKLCTLGLMNCEDIEGRRPYYSPHRDIHPHDVIYAQPVTIKPVGRPLPAIPVKGRPYGPAKPIPLPPSFGSPLGPNVYPGPSFGRPPPSFVGPYPGYKKPGLPPPFVSKPIYEYGGVDIEPDFEDKFIDKKQVVLHQPSGSGVQQHVHHHYHHGDAAGIANPGVVPSSPTLGSGLGSYGYGNGGTYGSTFNDFEDYKKAFKIKTPTSNSGPSISSSPAKGYADRYPAYEKLNGKQFASGGQLGANNQFLNNGGFDGDYQFNNGDNGFSSTSYEDCVCVPYDQCATLNHVGRKDDLYLAIDPRNLDKDIEAETVEVVITDGNGTMSVVRVPKGANETEETKNERTKEEAGKAEVTKRNRRDVKHAIKNEDKQEIRERLTVGTGNLDSSKLNVRPTWGVSFGLPQTGGVGPIAPHPGNSLGIPGYTPGYGLVGGQGINLGPVAVNPLVAVQVTKDEYGEKVVKPYVNLHVTPNPALIHKLGHLLAHKKYGLYGGHYGGHYGGNYGVYAPHYHTHHERPIYHYPSRPPFYPSHVVPHHEPIYHKPHDGFYPSYYKDDNDDYDDYDYTDNYQDDYYRNARVRNASATKGRQSLSKDLPKASSQGLIGGERQRSGKITFSNRRRRDTTALSETTSEVRTRSVDLLALVNRFNRCNNEVVEPL